MLQQSYSAQKEYRSSRTGASLEFSSYVMCVDRRSGVTSCYLHTLADRTYSGFIDELST